MKKEDSILVDVGELDEKLIIDIKYAKSENFMKMAVYPCNKLVLRRGTAKKLIAANNEFMTYDLKLKVLDGYRPLSVQKIMWDLLGDENFVAPISRGSVHNRGAAVDVILVDASNHELDMPSAYDEFTERAWIDYQGSTELERSNMEFMAQIMIRHGFNRIESEWWHFNDSEFNEYPIMDIDLLNI